MSYDCRYPLTAPKMSKTGKTFEIGLITDLDKLAKTTRPGGKDTVWKSLLMKATLAYNEATKSVDIEVASEEEAVALYSEYSRGGRGMELSELVVFNGKMYTVDDRTGIVYDISNDKAVPWVILADGDGNQDGGFKGEWMTVKDQKLYVGGHGREYVDWNTGEKKTSYLWVKVITKDGSVVHEDWSANFSAIKAAGDCPDPGYMTHESGIWSETHKQWFFLPRKACVEKYDHKLDEQRCTNMLIRCSEDFKDISVTRIGELVHKTRGFSTFKFIPGTDDRIIVAIKSEEIDDAQKSFLIVFDIDGNILMDDKEFSSTMKYEGLEFL